MAKNTVERKIMFYHIRSNPSLWNPRKQLDIPSMLKHIDTLPFPSPKTSGRYWVDKDGKTYCCWIKTIGTQYCSIQFGKLRHDSSLPQMEHLGTLSPVSSSIPTAASIAEVMHVVFFPDNIIGAEHNYYGPRMPALMNYLEKRTIDPITLYCDALLKHDAAEQLQTMKNITLLHLKIPATYLDIEEIADNDVIKGLKTFRNLSQADVLEVVLQRQRRQTLAQSFTKALTQLFHRDDFLTEVDKVGVKGVGGEKVDQLSDMLIVNEAFVKLHPNSRQIETEEMFKAIERGYNLLHKDLRRTVGIEL